MITNLPQRFGGFYTEEIRDHGARVGFKVVALEGGEAVFAHVDFTTPERVGKYGLDLTALEAVGVNAIHGAVQAQRPIVIAPVSFVTRSCWTQTCGSISTQPPIGRWHSRSQIRR